MLVRLQREYGNILAVALQGMLAGIVFGEGSRASLLGGGALLSAIGFPAWVAALRRVRAIADTPTSRIASAAQGYVELLGSARPLGGLPLLSPLTGLPCLWYRYRIERRENDKWVHDSSDESDASFLLDDGTGRCVIDPESAEILVDRHDTWIRDERRYAQWLLIDNDPLYALGDFVTRGSIDLDLDADEDVKALLAEWKKDRKSLLKRFDLDQNGEIDLKEWDLARRQAKREVAQAHREARERTEVHLMRRPDDGRLYLISSLPPDTLTRRYRLWSWAHLAFFFAGLAAVGYGWRL